MNIFVKSIEAEFRRYEALAEGALAQASAVRNNSPT